MSNNKFEKIINKIKVDMKMIYPDFKGIYFFGSRARGDFHDDSDYDIAIVFDRVINRKFKDSIRLKIIDYEIENQIIFDSHIYNFLEILNPNTPFREKIHSEGKYYDA